MGGDENWEEGQEGEICCIDAYLCLERGGRGDAPEDRSTPASLCGFVGERGGRDVWKKEASATLLPRDYNLLSPSSRVVGSR